MTFYAEIEPIEDRALQDGGDLVIAEIAKAKATPGDLSTGRLTRRLRWGKDGKRVYESLQALDNAGFVALRHNGAFKIEDVTLTAKGWEVAGQMGHKVPMEVMG